MFKYPKKVGVSYIFSVLILALNAKFSQAMIAQEQFVPLSDLQVIGQVSEDLDLLENYMDDLKNEGTIEDTRIFELIDWQAVREALESKKYEEAILGLLVIRIGVINLYKTTFSSKKTEDNELKNIFLDSYHAFNSSIMKLLDFIDVKNIKSSEVITDLYCNDSLLRAYAIAGESDNFGSIEDAFDDVDRHCTTYALNQKNLRHKNIREKLILKLESFKTEAHKLQQKRLAKQQNQKKKNIKKQRQKKEKAKEEKKKKKALERKKKQTTTIKKNEDIVPGITKGTLSEDTTQKNLAELRDTVKTDTNDSATTNVPPILESNVSAVEQVFIEQELLPIDSQTEEKPSFSPFTNWPKNKDNTERNNQNNEQNISPEKTPKKEANNHIIEILHDISEGNFKNVTFEKVVKAASFFNGKVTKDQGGSHRTILDTEGKRIGGIFEPHNGRTYGPKVLKKIKQYFEKARWTLDFVTRKK